MEPSSTTDWIQAIGVLLGVPATAIGIFRLFRESKSQKAENKKREIEISSLKDIAISQSALLGNMNKQLDEFQKQTKEFEYQSFLFRQANSLLSDQINLQNKIYDSEEKYKLKKEELEDKKRKNDLKPFFQATIGSGWISLLRMDVLNRGKIATYLNLDKIHSNRINITPRVPQGNRIAENNMFQIDIEPKANDTNMLKEEFEFNILFLDADGRKYKQHLVGSGMKVKVSDPEEILDI